MNRAHGAALIGLLAASSAMGASFKVQGQVDFGGPGGEGNSITGDFTCLNPSFPVAALGVGARIGSVMAPIFPNTPSATETSFAGQFMVIGGVQSTTSPSGRDGLALFDAGFGADFALTGVVRIQVRDSGGDDFDLWFTALGATAYLASRETVGDFPPEQQYRLMQYDNDGNRQLWIEAIPAPGALGLLAPMGLLAARRRR